MKRKRVWIVLVILLLVVIVAINWVLNYRGTTDIKIDNSIERIEVTSTAFNDMELIPIEYTGNGIDISPGFTLINLSDQAISIAIIMDDLDIPISSNYTHWVIWNIPAQVNIPEGISHGETSYAGATQGIAYGNHRYRGPKPPFGSHRYQFHIFVLDSMLELDSSATKKELLEAMEGHIIQYGTITGWYPTVQDN